MRLQCSQSVSEERRRRSFAVRAFLIQHVGQAHGVQCPTGVSTACEAHDLLLLPDGQCALSTDILPGIQKLPPAAVSVITRTARDAVTMVSDVSPRPLRGRHSLHPGVQPGLQFKPCRGNTA
jgi:hypothetical protein